MCRREVGGFTVWEIADQQAAPTEELVIEIPGGRVQHADLEVEEYEPVAFQPGKARSGAENQTATKQQQRVIQNVALTVAYDHLFVASHIDLLERVLKQAAAQDDTHAQKDPRPPPWSNLHRPRTIAVWQRK